MKQTHSFLVTITVDASQADVRHHIREAVRSYGGEYRPDYPLFNLSARAVTVKPVTQQAKKKPAGRVPTRGEIVPEGAWFLNSDGAWNPSILAGTTCEALERYIFPV